jgi:putative hydrolase of the HAD superfamily
VIEIVFFDAGETLLRPHPSFPELFAETARRAGGEVTVEAVAEAQSRLAPHLFDLAAEEGADEPLRYEGSSLSAEGSRRFWTHLYERLLAELGLADDGLATRLFEVFSDSSSYKLFDDVPGTLEQIKGAGYRLGLISNFESWLDEMLVELEVGHHFDPAIISGVVGVEKPDVRIYELALQRAGVAPENAVHVGDSPGMDVEPATEVGMHAVLLDRLNRYAGSPGHRVASLEELPQVVSKL